MKVTIYAACLSTTAVFGFCGSAYAGSLSATELLQQFNVITTGNVVSQGGFHVDGRALVGGDYTSNGDVVYMNGAGTDSGYADLIVQGTLTGAIQVNNGGSVMAASYDTTPKLNGGGSLVAYNTALVPENYGQVLSDYSAFLASQSQSDGVSVDWANNDFNAKGVTGDTAYFTITESQLATQRDFDFTFGSSTDWIVLNIYATEADKDFQLDTAKAQQGLSTMAHVVWNFVGFETVTLDGLYQGTFLADGATIINRGGNIEGSVFAENLISSSEVHANVIGELPDASTPVVPVPATLPLLLGGIGAIAALRRRKA